jgi:hypothetical protein
VEIVVIVHHSASPNVVIDESGAYRSASSTASDATNPISATEPTT